MSPVSKPQLSPANDDDTLTCDPPVGDAPPSCNESISACTPIHPPYHTTERYGMNDFRRHRIRAVLAANIAPYILGPMPPDAFLDRFLPSHSISIPESTPSFQAG